MRWNCEHPNTVVNFLNHISKWIATRGELDTILRLKNIRTVTYSVLSGNPVKFEGIGQYKSGLPKVFGPYLNQKFVLGDIWAIRSILTLLQVSRLIPA